MFTGKLQTIALSIDWPTPMPEDIKKLQEKAREKSVRDWGAFNLRGVFGPSPQRK